MSIIKCPRCGNDISDKDSTCSHCNYPLNESSTEKNEQKISKTEIDSEIRKVSEKSTPPQSKQCVHCGYDVNDLMKVCPNCGLPLLATATAAEDKHGVVGNSIPSRKKKKIMIPSIIAVVLVIIIAAIATSGPSVEEIVFEKSSYYTNVGDMGTVDYTIVPEEAAESVTDKIEWASSDPSIAKVTDGGVMYGVSVGTCTITASAPNGVEGSFELEVRPDMSDFKTIYNKFLDSSYARIAADGSYLLIDTNPNDIDDYSSDEALRGLVLTMTSLELPDSLLQKMSGTSALDGRQTQVYDDVEVSWTYHPDRGLEVLFSKN